jgi:hypothetical protein
VIYKVEVWGLEGVIDRLYQRISQLSRKKRWSRSKIPDSSLRDIEKSIDETFSSKHCLITGVQSKHLINGKISEIGISKIALAVKGGVMDNGPRMLPIELTRLRDGNNRPLRSRDFQWGRWKHDKMMFLVELESTIEVGTKLDGGHPIYNRIRVSAQEENRGGISGEWVIRQYLRSGEAEFIMRVVKSQERGGTDAVVAGVRGLTKVLEIDNALLREVRKYYEDTMGGDKMAIVMTFPHSEHASNSAYLDEYADEPIIVVCSMNCGGGNLIRKAFSRQKVVGRSR